MKPTSLARRVVLSHHAIDHIVINSSFWQSMLHQVRWMKSTRFSRPKGHFGTALTFSMPFGVLALAAAAATHHLAIGIGLFAWGIGYASSAVYCCGQLGGRRPRLAQPACPLSHSRSDGLFLLGRQLYFQQNLVARAPVSTATRREDAANPMTERWSAFQKQRRHGKQFVPQRLKPRKSWALYGTAKAVPFQSKYLKHALITDHRLAFV